MISTMIGDSAAIQKDGRVMNTGIHWLRECFEPTTGEKANGQWRMLISDGHDRIE